MCDVCVLTSEMVMVCCCWPGEGRLWPWLWHCSSTLFWLHMVTLALIGWSCCWWSSSQGGVWKARRDTPFASLPLLQCHHWRKATGHSLKNSKPVKDNQHRCRLPFLIMSVRCRAPATGPNKHFRGLPSVGFARCSGTMEGPGGRGIIFVTAHPMWQTTLYPACQIPCGHI